jgi:hypothetical protein
LHYSRHPVLPEDILYGLPAAWEQSFESEEAYNIHCSSAMAGTYKIMLKNQIAMAARNRMCRETHHSDVHFKKGEQVLYWQPATGQLKDAPPTANDDALPAHDSPADDGAPMDRTVKKLM